MNPLVAPTPPAWLPQALANMPAVLVDHAHCEKKAAAQAMSLIAQYGSYEALVLPLAALAREELRHFRQVFRLLRARNLPLTQDAGDPYVRTLLRCARDDAKGRLVDRLLLTGLVEARSAERLALLGEGLMAQDAALGGFYRRLAKSEAGHHRLFVRLAKKVAPAAAVLARQQDLAARESEVMLQQPLLPRVH